MHPQSLQLMKEFLSKLPRKDRLTVVDVGSYDESLRHKSLMSKFWTYFGVDIRPGPSVDVVLDPSINDWSAVPMCDVLISGQCLEHCQQPWEIVRLAATRMKPGAICCWIAPNTWHYHLHPIDCFRIWPDGMRGLFTYAGLETVSAKAHWVPDSDKRKGDTVGIARKIG